MTQNIEIDTFETFVIIINNTKSASTGILKNKAREGAMIRQPMTLLH